MKRRKLYRVLALAVLLVLGIVGGTTAYNTQTKQAVNEFRTGEYATELVEEFIPPSDWRPGISVNKDVKVRNNGTAIQWKTGSGNEWHDLVSLDTLRGADGEKGADGSNGKDGIDGKDGAAGKTGKDGADGRSGKRGTGDGIDIFRPAVRAGQRV